MHRRISNLGRLALVAAVITAGLVVAACGTSAAKSQVTSTRTGAGMAAADARGPRGGGMRTRSPELQTSVAQGTPAPFRGTVSPDIQTSVAEGTPFAFRGMAPSDVQTSIAQGTPRAGGFGGRGRILGLLSSVLNVPAPQLQTELQAIGATVASVGAAHGRQRPALRQALIAAFEQRTAQQLQAGSLTQDAADQADSQFTATIDSVLNSNSLDQPGTPGP